MLLSPLSSLVFDSLFELGRVLVVSCAADLFIKVWDTMNDWKNIKTMAGHDHSISSVKFMPGDDFIVSAGRDRSIRIWNVALG